MAAEIMDEKMLQDRTEVELREIIAALAELISLPSRWSGRVELVPDAGFKGKKRFTCDIQIDAALASQEVRWSTLIHEALHTISTGYVPTDYRDFPGWEEGVVERLQRVYRPAVLGRLGISVEDEVFRVSEKKHSYNKYIQALEGVRSILNVADADFYISLLQTPIRGRFGYVYGLGNKLISSERSEFIRVLSTANSVLKDFA